LKPRARTKAIVQNVETDQQAEVEIKPTAAHPRRVILCAELRPDKHISRNGNEQDRNCAFKKGGLDVTHRQGAARGTQSREAKAPEAIPQWDGPGVGIMPGGAAGAKGGLEFVCAQGVLRRQAKAQQHGNRNQAAATGDRVHEAGNETSGKQQRKMPGREHVLTF
jgi:hypothetical protein